MSDFAAAFAGGWQASSDRSLPFGASLSASEK